MHYKTIKFPKVKLIGLTGKRWGKREKASVIRINNRGNKNYKKETVVYLLGFQKRERE